MFTLQNEFMFSTTTRGFELIENTSDNCENHEMVQLNFTVTYMLAGAEIRCVATDIVNHRKYFSNSSGPLILLEPSMFELKI